jgi:MFS transporter, OPA family, sugar phosphate sensor protein UhpC
VELSGGAGYSAGVRLDPARQRARREVFALTWVAYASYYLCRKGFPVTKARLADEFHLSLPALGAIDTGYLTAYALGLFASGLMCDVIGARRLVGAGMLLAAAATAGFGLGSTSAVFALSFALNGLFQSTGWPGTVKAMTPWFTPVERGKVMGLWSTCYQVGGLAATALAARLLTTWGWRSAFLVPAAFTAAVGVAVLLWLRQRPEAEPTPPSRRTWRPHTASLRALTVPLLWNLGAAYFCLKLIRYSLLFWLPLYLHRQLGYAEGSAAYMSISFEVGGVLGAIAAGAVSDRLVGRRGVVLVVMSLGLAGAFVLYSAVAAVGPVANFAAMALVGFMLFGPDALASSTAAQDLGGVAAAGTTAGVINGIGSLGAMVQGSLTAYVAGHYGWPALFQVFIVLAVLCALILTPFALRERARLVPATDGIR